ncbi:MAG TPA: tetratricopeptide repeat protein [Phycisphaerae bacterium]|nr:tetratricopeptide repeat protein [Phycisphaerae bacterium]
MKAFHGRILTAALFLVFCGSTAAQEADVAQLEKQLAADPTSFKAKVALAEGYLRACELEKSLKLWREVLTAAPDHERAKRVVGKLSLQLADLDGHLDVLEKLIDKGITGGVDGLLEAAGARAASDAQKARVVYLRGRLALTAKGGESAAIAHFQSAMKLYPAGAWAGHSAIALSRLEQSQGREDEARRLLQELIAGKEMADQAVKDEARCELVVMASRTPQEAVAGLRELLAEVKTPKVRRMILRQISAKTLAGGGDGPAAAIEAETEILANAPSRDEAAEVLHTCLEYAKTSQDRVVLEAIVSGLEKNRPKDAGPEREASFVTVEALLSRAVVEGEAEKMRGLVAGAGKMLARLEADQKLYRDGKRLEDLRGRAMLVEAQKLIALGGAAEGLPALMKAKEHYLAAMPGDPKGSLARLTSIARLLEHVKEWEMAVALYREVAARFGHLARGRDALWRVAWLYDYKLDAPMAALEVYAQYASRYPAELPYRELGLGSRLARLGYANVLDFQKRKGLKTDGIAGSMTIAELEELEGSFDAIAARDGGSGEMLRGQFAHPAIFDIARRLEAAGRSDEAIKAYRMFLSLNPTKAQADDALIAVARIFRDNLMFTEAIGAYEELMEDFPKGNVTSEAYIEAAGCLENLGRWKEASELYRMYVKKFPKYKHVGLCNSRLALLEEIIQYEDFIASNGESPKLAEARYQIAAILYKKLNNLTKGAVQFAEVAALHPKHVRAADGLFTCGVAQLHTGNFPAARKAFGELVTKYPDSRLADDAQYWIGHTYEYSARALGRLDAARIVVKRRSLQARRKLLVDAPLRRQYNPAAKPGPEMPEDVWGGDDPLGLGVLTSGSKRDRVNADLSRAIAAYRQVVEKFKMGDKAGEALMRIGAIYTDYLKDPEKGIEAYRELLAHYPGSREAVGALFQVGVYHMNKKAYGEAITAFQQFIYNYRLDPKVEEAMLAIAKCYADKKEWDKALDSYQGYLSKYPDGKYAAFAKGQIEWIRMYHF